MIFCIRRSARKGVEAGGQNCLQQGNATGNWQCSHQMFKMGGGPAREVIANGID